MRLRWTLLFSLIVAPACGKSTPPAADTSGDQALGKAVHAYVVESLRRNPTTNTYLGGAGLDPSLHDVDGTLRDHAMAALTSEDQWLTSTQKALEAIPPTTLSPNARIDRDVALAQIGFVLHQHQVRRYQERALDTYVIEPFRAIDWQLQGMTATGEVGSGATKRQGYGTADEWDLVIKRLQAVPRYMDAAQAQLTAGVSAKNTPDRRMIQRDGIGAAESTAKYFAVTLPGLAAERVTGPSRDKTLAAIKEASAGAAVAYLRMRDFVATTFFTDRSARTLKPEFVTDRFALGEAEYNWALKNNLRLDTPSSVLYDESWAVVEATRTQMVTLATQIAEAHKWPVPKDGAVVRAVFDQLSKDYPKSDTEMITWYRDAAFRLVDFARRTGLFDVPGDYKLDVTETPPPLQASIDGAAYYPAPPFRNTGVGRFYVTPTHNDQAALQSNNRAALADLSAHEGFPGHDWYYKVMTRFRDLVSPVRWLTPGAVEDSSAMWEDSLSAEGWGLYAEALMAEPQPDAPSGFYTPEEHLYQLQGQLYRDLRVRIDTGLHTGRITYDDATTMFSEVVDFLPGSCAAPKLPEVKRASCDAAERAIFRYSKWPTQAITYRIGKAQIYALRAEAMKQLGPKFSARDFHLAFIRQGTIPSGYFKDTLLAELK